MTQKLQIKEQGAAARVLPLSVRRRNGAISALLICHGICNIAFGALAADRTSSCCSDLESRIEELSATTPKSARLELEVSGQLHRSALFWSDVAENNTYIVDPSSGGSYLTFSGDVELNSKWEAGFLLEIETPINASGELSQSVSSSETGPALGAAKFFIANEDVGSIGLGQQTEAHDLITELDLSATDDFAGPAVTDWNGTFLLRRSSSLLVPSNSHTWSQFGADDIGDGEEAPVIRFDTAEERKLHASLSWGMGGVTAAALRYAEDWGNVEVIGGAAFAYYAQDTRSPCRDQDDLAGCGTVAGSISAKHKPSGISAGLAFGFAAINPSDASGEDYWYYVKLASAWSLTTLGSTTTYAEHYHGVRNVEVGFDELRIGATGSADISATTNVIGFGVMQTIDSLEIDFYLAFRNYEIEADIGAQRSPSIPLESFSAIMAGSRITF